MPAGDETETAKLYRKISILPKHEAELVNNRRRILRNALDAFNALFGAGCVVAPCTTKGLRWLAFSKTPARRGNVNPVVKIGLKLFILFLTTIGIGNFTL